MKKATDTTLAVSAGYQQFIQELKTRVISARISAARAITHEAVLLYWDIGRGIVERQKEHGWGDSVVEVIAADLQRALPGAKGFSQRNVWRMPPGGDGGRKMSAGATGLDKAHSPCFQGCVRLLPDQKIMPHSVKSQFSIISDQLDADYFREVFPWRVTEAREANERFPSHITMFDLGVGEHERVDKHLDAVRQQFLSHADDLDAFVKTCNFTLWVYYEFPPAEGALKLLPLIHATFAMFRVEVIFHLKPAL